MKDKQEEALKSLLDGKDVFAVLPTGFGKSLIYQSFVIAKEMDGCVTDPYATPKVTKYQKGNFITEILKFTVKIAKSIQLASTCFLDVSRL